MREQGGGGGVRWSEIYLKDTTNYPLNNNKNADCSKASLLEEKKLRNSLMCNSKNYSRNLSKIFYALYF